MSHPPNDPPIRPAVTLLCFDSSHNYLQDGRNWRTQTRNNTVRDMVLPIEPNPPQVDWKTAWNQENLSNQIQNYRRHHFY